MLEGNKSFSKFINVRYITAIILAVCISINSLAGTVGMLVLCLHENFVHVNFNARHFCCQSAG